MAQKEQNNAMEQPLIYIKYIYIDGTYNEMWKNQQIFTSSNFQINNYGFGKI